MGGDHAMKKIFIWFNGGISDDRVVKRVLFLYIWFFVLLILATVISYFVFPEGFFRGKHPGINKLELSSNLFSTWKMIFLYNMMPLMIIIISSLYTAKYKFTNQRFIPMGYFAFTSLTVLFGVYLGTWSFDISSEAPNLLYRIVSSFDITKHSGFLEFSSYLIGAAASYKISLWHCDSKKVLYRKPIKEIKLNNGEKILLLMSVVLLLLAALIEAAAISKVT